MLDHETPVPPADEPTEQEMARTRLILRCALDLVTAPNVDVARRAMRTLHEAGHEPLRETVNEFTARWCGVRQNS
jgi:hypothetical protein